jgi:diguanylate cyclase (GGDEF)-like protein/PAS domain S-box-containing protein
LQVLPSYDLRLVVLSIAIAPLASFVALDLAGRTQAATGRSRALWLAAGSVTMGLGIWSMHFIGMLAFGLRANGVALPIGYAGFELFRSVVIAIGASAVALTFASRRGLTTGGVLIAGTVLGGAIAGMFYLGMAAMRMPARLTYSMSGVVLSFLIAIVASTIALALEHQVGTRAPRVSGRRAKRTSAVVLGIAMAAMHYTATAAARFTPFPDPSLADGTMVLATSQVALLVTAGALVLLGLANVATALDQQRNQLGQTLQKEEARFRSLTQAASDAILSADGHGFIVFWNSAAQQIFGYTASEAVGQPIGLLVSPHERETSFAIAAEAAECTVHLEGRRWDGSAFPMELTLSKWMDGTDEFYTGIVRDVTQQKLLEAQLAHQAFHDSLTGLANRALFRDRVSQAVSRGSRRGVLPAVLFIDIDNFKSVNDGISHEAGDSLLRVIARRLSEAIRTSDTCARVGGDEFAVLVEANGGGSVVSDAAHMAERIFDFLRLPCEVNGSEIVVSVSIGIAVARVGDDDADLLRNADLAMYRAKSRGKGRYEVFEPAMHQAIRKRLELETELRRSIEQALVGKSANGERAPFVIHYQPIATMATGYVSKVEALVRWDHPRRGLVAPMEFIPIAEEMGLIVPLGRWILREACRQTRAWQRAYATSGLPQEIGVTVNLSARQLLQPELPSDVAAALRDSGLPAGSLTLEMTESMLVEDSNAVLARLRALKALGVRLAIDDFGTGYSSLAYLERFPVDLLKIDKSFVDKIGAGMESPLARAMIGLGRELGIHVVAEGIETHRQWSSLRDLGCEMGQGFYLSRPLPAGLLTEAMVARGSIAP